MIVKTRTAVKKPVATKLERSSLAVFDIPLDLLDGDEQNPNEMDDSTLDELVESMRDDGFDEPIQVIPSPLTEGRYHIAGGHHRVKAARRLGLTVAPAVIKTEWSTDQAKFALMKRNILKGQINGQKFTALWQDLAKRYDPVLLKKLMGFTKTSQFDALYEGAMKTLAPKQKAALAKAKETITSVDDLASILNTIFKEAGSEMQEGYAVFSFGGKDQHYIQIDAETNRKLKAMKKSCESGNTSMRELLQSIIANVQIADYKPASIKPRPRPK